MLALAVLPALLPGACAALLLRYFHPRAGVLHHYPPTRRAGETTGVRSLRAIESSPTLAQ